MLVGVGLCVHNSTEAVETYRAAFRLELGYHVLNDDGSYFHSELYRDGEELLNVVEAPAPRGDNPVQLCFCFEDRAALEHAFAILKQGGRVLMDVCRLPWSPCAAEVLDRFGIRWYLTTPMHRPPDSFTPADCTEQPL